MEIGDPKQAAILAVMAVGALVLLVSRMGPKPLVPVVDVKAEAKHEAPVPAGTLFASLRDPFSHLRLAPPIPKAPDSGPPETKSPAPLPGLPRALPPLANDNTPTEPLTPEIPPRPEPPKPPAPTRIALEAVLGASDAVAYLTVDGAESQPFRPNDRVKGAIRLVAVGDGTVVLSGPKGRVTLDVGESSAL